MQVQTTQPGDVRCYEQMTPEEYSAGLAYLRNGTAETNHEYSEEEGRQDFINLLAPTPAQIQNFEAALAATA